jgi:inner membrane protein
MEPNQPERGNAFQSFRDWSANSITLKIIGIGILILLMLIPLDMVETVIRERHWRGEDTMSEIATDWGDSQTIIGPVLMIPFEKISYQQKVVQGQTIVETIALREVAHFLPETLDIAGQLQPDRKKRGIYSVPIYLALLDITARFNAPDFERWKGEKRILWDEAEWLMGISDKKGVQQFSSLMCNGEAAKIESLPDSPLFRGGGIRAKANVTAETKELVVTAKPEIRGSRAIYFSPAAGQTNVQLSSSWPDPSFRGSFLPEPTTPGPDGFEAKWSVTHLSHNFPLAFQNHLMLDQDTFGVELFEAVSLYTLSERAVKYGILVIVLTFAAFFFIQVMSGRRIHFVQYLLVGLLLSIFYILLLSLAEVLSFRLAYGIASAAVLTLSAFYMSSVLGGTKRGIRTNLIIAGVYAFIFIIIQMEQYALLAGSIGLFVILAIVMTITRKVDWYQLRKKPE